MKTVIYPTLACAALPTFAVDETGFEATYQQKVWPWFTASRTSGEFRASDGVMLRWFAIEAAHERAALVVLPGWTETAESFAEELYDLRDLGLSFYVLDHRCQGLSAGEIEPRDRWHVKDWRSFRSDTELFLEKVVRAKPHRRIVLYGNSMGGALATAFLAWHPGAAQALVMTVPMFGIQTPPFPAFVVTTTSMLYTLFGKGSAYLPGNRPYRREPFAGNAWSITSRARYEQLDRLNESRAEYQMGGVTARGGLELVRLSRASLEAAAKIDVPALLVQAGKDSKVRNDLQDRAVRAMRDCRKVVVADAHHVMMHETDSVRGQALAAIRSFLEEQAR